MTRERAPATLNARLSPNTPSPARISPIPVSQADSTTHSTPVRSRAPISSAVRIPSSSSGLTLARRLATQRHLLNDGAALVKPGRRLIYATCSLLCEENEDQVDAFLATHDDFRRAGDDVVRTPAADGCDGVYAAVLERRVS